MSDRLRWRVPRLLRNALHGIEDEHCELRPHLIGIEIRGLDGPAEPRRRVPGLSLVHHESDDVIRALLTGAKVDVRPRELVMNLANRAFERALHPAMGNG